MAQHFLPSAQWCRIQRVQSLSETLRREHMASEGCACFAGERLGVTLLHHAAGVQTEERRHTPRRDKLKKNKKLRFPASAGQPALNKEIKWAPKVESLWRGRPLTRLTAVGNQLQITAASPALCRCTVISPSAYNSLTITGVSPFVMQEICLVDSFGRKPIWVFDAITHH